MGSVMSKTCFFKSPVASQQDQESVMSLSKFSGDNLAEDLMPLEVWRKTFRFLSIMELVKLRQVCKTFKDEVGLQKKLGIFVPCEELPSKGSVHRNLCSDPRYFVPNISWIRLKNLKEHLPTLKSVFPSVKVLVMNSSYSFNQLMDASENKLFIEDTLDSFVHLESLAIGAEIECRDTNRSHPKLKHLCLYSIYRTELPSFPSLESLQIQIQCDFSKLIPWMTNNFGRPSKSFEIQYRFSGDRDYSLQCLSSLSSSLQHLKTGNFFGYKRRFKPMFLKLVENRRQEHRVDNIVDYGHTEFIDFLKDHRLTLKKVTTHLEEINDDQVEVMLSCLSHGTHIKVRPLFGLEHRERQYRLIRRLCRDRNLDLEINGLHLSLRLGNASRFLNILPTIDSLHRFFNILPPETQSLELNVYDMTHDETSCRRLIQEMLAYPMRSIILYFDQTEEEYKRTWSTAIQGLPETHEAILEWFYAKPKRLIIRRRN